jgi:uncharacterized protein
MRVAAVADLHCTAGSQGEVIRALAGVESKADVLVVAGDLTNLGLVEEMQVLLDDLAPLSLPKVAVTGNHDHESGQVESLVGMMKEAGWHVLDGDAWELDGVGFVGTKGFCGGFGRHRLMPFGESLLKDFIQVSIDEAARLESALAGLRCRRRVAVLHYAPIAGTLVGEDPQIYPFLGYSLLAEGLDRHGVDLIVHGHAHDGSPEGTTPGGIPVRNVSQQVLRRHGTAYAVFDI